MTKLIFTLFLIIFTILNILNLNNTHVQVSQNNIRQINWKDEVLVNTQSSFNLATQEQRQAKFISSQQVKTKLTDNPLTPTQVTFPLSTPLEIDTARSEEVYLLEIQVAYQGEPIGNYSVYLNLPSLKAIADIDTYYIGSANFFDVPSPNQGIKKFNFDITPELIKQVQKRVKPSKIPNLTLTFIRDQGHSSTELVIDRVALSKL
ncbi:MAG: hypothetical protein RMZ42_07080 [Nostoc sp. DedQUE05]|uniref:hypothetical protein n=1 Tax=Nostoc sp. DedQUE05 TaxID=3075391 RepID=UPI002AD43E5E|nr:hypothetical protein [Nostoc sp. DedQUE05]MDZ8091689.1 hypothetical protein [Nostoc sp. DedQUE05]